VLWCSDNSLSELDLSHTPGLTELDCSDNYLFELDLSHTPELTELHCSNDNSEELKELDIRNNPKLKICEVGDGVKIIKHEWQLRDE
jgi:Leucine-rich repeat (LRR) protein